MKKRFVVLEDMIPYDWDDYDLWGVVYYDSVEDKVSRTSYGHGQDWSDRKESMKLEECSDEEKAVIKKALCKKYANVGIIFEWAACFKELGIEVLVEHGRKMKGKQGVVLCTYTEQNSYMKRRYPWRDWSEWYAMVKFDGVEDPIRIAAHYLKPIDPDAVNAKLADKMANCNEIRIKELAHIGAYEMSYSSCDTRNAKNAKRDALRKVLPL